MPSFFFFRFERVFAGWRRIDGISCKAAAFQEVLAELRLNLEKDITLRAVCRGRRLYVLKA
jgi:hypothetical protein